MARTRESGEMTENPWAPDELTDKIMRTLPRPVKGNRIKRDTLVKGFAGRNTAADAKAFVLDYRVKSGPEIGTERRYTIGAFPDWLTAPARNEARRLKRLISQGHDPVGEREHERRAPSVSDLCDRFLAEHVEPHNKPRTRAEYRRMIEQI